MISLPCLSTCVFIVSLRTEWVLFWGASGVCVSLLTTVWVS